RSVVLALCAVDGLHAQSTGTANPLVDRTRERVGAAAFERAKGFQLSGTTESNGLQSRFSLWVAPDGRYELAVDGKLPSFEGFDGTRAFRRDVGTGERTLVLGDRDEQLAQAWFLSPYWLVAGDRIAVSGTSALEMAFAGSPMHGTIEVDAKTGLPAALAWGASEHGGVLTWKSWKESGGVQFPAEWEQRGPRGQIDRYVVERVEARGAPAPRGPLPAALALDARVVGDGGTIELEQAPTGHLLVHPTIGGRDIGWFIFDTGAAVNVLSTPVAEREGYAGFGGVKVGGVGGAVDAQFLKPGELALGPLRSPNALFLTMDLAFLEPFLKREIAGVLGYPLLLAGTYELDMTPPRLAVHAPGKEPAFDAPTPWEELVIYKAHSCVYASFEGDRRGLFTLDTGAGQGGVVFSSGVIGELGLLEGRKVSNANIGGVGGFVTAKSGTIEWLQLGSQRFESVAALFPDATKGHVGDRYLTGTLSTKLLEPFTTVFDYPGQRIAFVPRVEKPAAK
ncbi:MAG: hypothetical protein EPO68_12780, partial [Planctomycetota bacterium]